MKTIYKYIFFTLEAENPKTKVWAVRNKGSQDKLGIIQWYGPWRQYCYFPCVQAVYSIGCLRDIIDFIESISKKEQPEGG